jgi:hypothetical protein
MENLPVDLALAPPNRGEKSWPRRLGSSSRRRCAIDTSPIKRATPYATKRRPGFYWRSKTRRLHFVSTTEMLEPRAEVVKGHDKLLEANNREVERRHMASNAGIHAQGN